MKMPIVAVSPLEISTIYRQLYELGWHAYPENGGDGKPYPDFASAFVGHSARHAISHVILYNHWGHPRSIWTCGANRPFSEVINQPGWNATLVNSRAHMIAYTKRLNAYLAQQAAQIQ